MSAAVFQTGIIDVGAHAVRMEIFEVDSSGKYSLWESLTRASRLGTDVFRTGFVSPESVDALAAVMGDYAARLKEYGITEIRAFATSAIREAGNRDLVTDRIRHDSGINLEIMDSAIETELIYSSMKKQLPSLAFSDSAPVIAVVIGSGSLFVILIRNGELKFCEEIPLGTDRFSGVFGSSKVTPDQFLEELRSLDIPQRLAESAGFEPEEPVHFITMGAAPRLAVGKANSNIVISTEKALELISGFRETPVAELTAALGVSADDGAAGIGAAVILECFLRIFGICPHDQCETIGRIAAIYMITHDVIERTVRSHSHTSFDTSAAWAVCGSGPVGIIRNRRSKTPVCCIQKIRVFVNGCAHCRMSPGSPGTPFQRRPEPSVEIQHFLRILVYPRLFEAAGAAQKDGGIRPTLTAVVRAADQHVAVLG